MTAEVAILNKSAVALAADSAVSIGRPANRKVYNTVNKIFELSERHPIGIMIYGRLDFMGLPLETIIKEYRWELGDKSFSYVHEYRESFCHYLQTSVAVHPEDQKSNAFINLHDAFTNANSDVDGLILEDMIKRGSFQKSKVNFILQKYIKDDIARLRSLDFAEGSNRKSLPSSLSVVVNACIQQCFKSLILNETSKKIIRDWAGYLLSKKTLSEIRTGIVTAGFGDLDFCTSLDNIEIDGIVDGELKHICKPYLDIGRHKTEADILGFAQDDMVKSFLNGIDPLFDEYVRSATRNAIVQSSELLLSAIITDPADLVRYGAALKSDLDKIAEDVNAELTRYITQYSSSPIREMIRAMPKQELASLASSLIEITSLKRKVTRAQETVGGPVDVAIISKSEGFVWTQRKHYFPAELNKRFFVRRFGVGG